MSTQFVVNDCVAEVDRFGKVVFFAMIVAMSVNGGPSGFYARPFTVIPKINPIPPPIQIGDVELAPRVGATLPPELRLPPSENNFEAVTETDISFDGRVANGD